MKTYRLTLLTLLAFTLATTARADDSLERQFAHFASGNGNLAYLALGAALPLIRDGRPGRDYSLRIADATVTSLLVTYALKETVREKRPDSNERDSFPSGHATAAFAVATMESAFHPKEAWLWYGGAGAIAWSRVRLDRHYTQDVVSGAAIGYLAGTWELSRRRGLLISPFVGSLDGGRNGFRLEMVKGL